MAANDPVINVRGTVIRPEDGRELYRQKLARITLDSMVQFVGLLDANGTVLEINKVALDGVGIQLSEVEGRPFWTTFWWQVSEEINTTLRESIARAAQGEFVRWDAEIYGRASGKETIIIDASLCPVTDETGKVVFIAAEGRDITEKKAQERLIAQKNVELQGLLERIRELDEVKTQFFANVSHELRTPLALIMGPAQRLASRDVEMDAAQREESANVILRSGQMLLKHVNDILDIAKFDAGKLKIHLQETDVSAVMRLVVSHFEVLAEERHITFMREIQPDVMAAVDTEKLQRVAMNLLSNAFKFVPLEGAVRARFQQVEQDMIFSVEDSGPGVKPALRKAIFERFRQGDGGADRQFGGTGLGLAIAKEFVEMHRGTVEVLDSPLGGALFQVTLPARRASQGKAGPHASLEPGMVRAYLEELSPAPVASKVETAQDAGASLKPMVLVVEDNAEMNRFIVEALVDEYEVTSAFDGDDGLEKALAIQPTLIITDLMMPRVSGVRMIEEVRRHPVLAEVPILVLTAKADEDLKLGLLETGAQDFVAKPFSERELLVRVRNLIQLKASQERERTLLHAMDQGFCKLQVTFDENEKPVDYRFLEVNSAFEKHTGVTNAEGRLMRELIPDLEESWFEYFGKVALTGESIRFENHAEKLGRCYEVYAFRIGRPQQLALG